MLPHRFLAVVLAILTSLSLAVVASPAQAADPVPWVRPVVTDRTASSLALAWDVPPGAEKFRVQVSTSSAMKKPIQVDFTGASGTVTGLRSGTVYYVRMAAINPSTNARISSFTPTPYATALTTVTTFPRGYPRPVSATPRAVSATGSTIGLDWADSADVGGYRLQYSTSSAMKKPKLLDVADSRATLEGLKPGTTYYVRVAALAAVGGALTSDYTAKPYAVVSTEAKGTSDLRVGSFNISGVNNDRGRALDDPRTWISRRPSVVSDIVSSGLDVVGLQEANQSLLYNNVDGMDYLPDGNNQYRDLLVGLRQAGQSWAVTGDAPYNCVNATSSNNCEPQERGASLGTRIVYNTDRLEMVDAGSIRFAAQYVDPAGVPDHERYMAWAIFEMKDSGRRFFFSTAHLTWKRKVIRQAQWQQLLDETKARRGKLPVVVTGDLNFSKFDPQTKVMLPAMKKAGFGDVLNQSYGRSKASGVRARTVLQAQLNSFHGFVRDLDGNSRCYCRALDRIGNNIDWIFTTNALTVKRWETVADLDVAFDQRGDLRSDHHLVTATIAVK